MIFITTIHSKNRLSIFFAVQKSAKITVTATPTATPNPTDVATPPPAKTEVTITSPANNAYVDMIELVRGASQNIPDGQHLWIIVRVDGADFAHEVKTINTDGTWNQDIQIGQNVESGKRYDLKAVLVNSVVHEAFQKWRDETKNPYDLILPASGLIQYSAVTVTRR